MKFLGLRLSKCTPINPGNTSPYFAFIATSTKHRRATNVRQRPCRRFYSSFFYFFKFLYKHMTCSKLHLTYTIPSMAWRRLLPNAWPCRFVLLETERFVHNIIDIVACYCISNLQLRFIRRETTFPCVSLYLSYFLTSRSFMFENTFISIWFLSTNGTNSYVTHYRSFQCFCLRHTFSPFLTFLL